jgi:hypothetical protein
MRHRLLPVIACSLHGLFLAAAGEPPESAPAARPRSDLADYDAELRRPDGRVDTEALAGRLKDLGVATYYWLIWHAPTDWDDLKQFLPKARAAGIDVWVYLVPPSESPPSTTLYSEPFRLDFNRWAEEIARLSLEHQNLTAWVIDDFYANSSVLTPKVVGEMRERARRLQPRLQFLPLMYYGEVTRRFAEDYHQVIDGVVVAYPRDRGEIEGARSVLDDAVETLPGQISYPWNTPSKEGDFASVSQPAEVLPGGPYRIRFQEWDDFTGPTSGYHLKQLLIDEAVVWEEDVAGGAAGPREVAVDVAGRVAGKKSVSVSFRLFDRKGVSNFGVRWRPMRLEAEGLRLAEGLGEPGRWHLARQGAFEAGFGDGVQGGRRRFHLPFFVMTAGDLGEFRLRHGEPASPRRMAEWLRMSLEAWRDGQCDGVVTYCLDKSPGSESFDLARQLFGEFSAPSPPRSKKLIEFGWDEPDTAFLRKHIQEMERTPFDGCVFHVNARKVAGKPSSLTWDSWGKHAFTDQDVAEALEDLRATPFKKFTDNFLRFITTPADLDWFDDHTQVLANARVAARLAREGKCRGLLFDIEQYNAPLFNYPKQRDVKTKSWDDYAAQARLRGREVMEAFQEGFPDLVVFLTFGYSLPWAQTGGGKGPLADASYGLLAPFMDGLVAGVKGKTRLVDGHELSYGYKDTALFARERRTMLEGLLPMVLDREKYPRVISPSFGLWIDHDWRKNGWNAEDPSKNYYSPETFEAITRAALESAGEYVWIYSETPRWWSADGGPVKLPAAYAEALRRAASPAPTRRSP